MSKVDILYIHPLGKNPSFASKYFSKNNKNNAKHFFGFIPMGIIGIVNNLIKNNIKVRGINLPLKKRVNPSFKLKECLDYYKPKIILIDIHWYVHIKHALEITKEIKKNSDAKVIVGGLSATEFYKQLIKVKDIDYVIKGDAEKPLLELAKAILKKEESKKKQPKKEKTKQEKQKTDSKDQLKTKLKSIPNIVSKELDNDITYCATDIDNYDYVTLDWLDDKDSYLNMFDSWLLVGKGCPYDCEECDGAHKNTKILFGRNKTIFRSAKNIVTDLKKIESPTVSLSLDLNILPEEIIKEISKNHFNLNLRNEYFRLADIKKIKKIEKSFNSFDFVFSPDTGDDEERKKHGKDFTNAQFLGMLKKLDKADFNGGIIVYFTDYIISPLKVKKFNEKARKDLIKKIEEIVPYALIKVLPWIIDPGTLKGKMDEEKIFKIYSS